MELGMDGVLMNSAISQAKHPVKMAGAMKKSIEAGRMALEAGRMPKRLYAKASSPEEGLLEVSGNDE
jgi:thiazole synthase